LGLYGGQVESDVKLAIKLVKLAESDFKDAS
jgi:hypothetical protein